jgi:eukaryotic-like serine/threonine-protein kinase
MDLWTEYEGRTIDGVYPLTKLIRPEGRSAFFSTPNGTGLPTVIRLIESHFDGDDIVARWQGVEALNHPNLVKLKKFGHVVVDDTPLVYAVMETVDGNLAEILVERRLTEQETREVAISMLAALKTLHENGFVHEHMEPANVLAVGEVIKLRSDCIREAPEGEDGYALKQRDVHGYAVVLLQALTQQKTLEGLLPAPFNEIVRKGMNGDWGLKEIENALTVGAPAAPAIAKREDIRVGTTVPPGAPPVASVAPSRVEPASPPKPKMTETPLTGNRVRLPVEVEEESTGFSLGLGAKIAMVVVVLLAAWFGWRLLHGRSAEQSNVPPANAAPVLDNGTTRPTPPVVVAKPAAGVQRAPATPKAAIPKAAIPQEDATSSSGKWRVIAFTYNHEDQAQHKAETIAREHPDLKPEVFSPTGNAPYLVTLGGAMSKEDAFALSGKAKREGLPQDVYAQNYRNR